MAIYFNTDTPRGLLTAFNEAIDDSSITTWERDTDGDYTHKADLWKRKLWLHAVIDANRLAFYTIPPQDKKIQRNDFAYYHGHLIETFINHFHNRFEIAQATPNPAEIDRVG